MRCGRYDRHAAFGEEKARQYLDSWLPSVLPHLQRRLGEVPGQALDGTDALALMSLCGFETAQPIYSASGSTIPWSPWCDLYKPLGKARELELWKGYAQWLVLLVSPFRASHARSTTPLIE